MTDVEGGLQRFVLVEKRRCFSKTGGFPEDGYAEPASPLSWNLWSYPCEMLHISSAGVGSANNKAWG